MAFLFAIVNDPISQSLLAGFAIDECVSSLSCCRELRVEMCQELIGMQPTVQWLSKNWNLSSEFLSDFSPFIR